MIEEGTRSMQLNRRHLLGAAGAAGAATLMPGAAAIAAQQGPAPAPTKDGKTALTADQALALLKEGNRRFVADMPAQGPISRRRRLDIAKGQAPFAVLVSCSDSRVGPEQLFGRGLGELFIVRNAGNTASSNEAMGSIEFGVGVLGAPLIVVLGHERCGAVAAATQIVEKNASFPGSIGRMVEPIVPAALMARGQPGDYVENAGRANVRRTVQQLRTAVEPILLEPQKQGRLKVVGAYYDLDTGAVEWME
jgi:carbonic anhydrase